MANNSHKPNDNARHKILGLPSLRREFRKSFAVMLTFYGQLMIVSALVAPR
jgi:hypothetical protein